MLCQCPIFTIGPLCEQNLVSVNVCLLLIIFTHHGYNRILDVCWPVNPIQGKMKSSLPLLDSELLFIQLRFGLTDYVNL